MDTAKAIRDGKSFIYLILYIHSFPGLIEHYPELDVKPSKTLDRLVRERKYGQKSGEGFYKYKAKM